jgi:hypothetical protein
MFTDSGGVLYFTELGEKIYYSAMEYLNNKINGISVDIPVELNAYPEVLNILYYDIDNILHHPAVQNRNLRKAKKIIPSMNTRSKQNYMTFSHRIGGNTKHKKQRKNKNTKKKLKRSITKNK